MITYIKKDIKGFYIDFPEEIDPIYWEGMIGETLQDFYDGKWVKLSNEQVVFHELNQNASINEVFNMQLNVPTQASLLDAAKIAKIAQINDYDSSSNINDFTVNYEDHAWFTPEMRSNYRNSIDAAKLLGVDELQVFVGNNLVSLSTQTAEQMLASILLYADQCFIVTKQHISAVQAMNNIEDIENYDYTVGYPDKINFTL